MKLQEMFQICSEILKDWVQESIWLVELKELISDQMGYSSTAMEIVGNIPVPFGNRSLMIIINLLLPLAFPKDPPHVKVLNVDCWMK